MIQIIAMFIQIVLVAIFGLLTLVFLVRWIIVRKHRGKRNGSVILTIVFGLMAYAIGSYSMTSQESSSREELVPVFERQFGFTPPNSVKEIKAKKFALYDAEAEWICFTYDSIVLNTIIKKDELLTLASIKSKKAGILRGLRKNKHRPDWLELPDVETATIYFKQGYLERIQSDFYLWVNQDKTIIYVQASNHD